MRREAVDHAARHSAACRRHARQASLPVFWVLGLGVSVAGGVALLSGCPGMSDEELLAGKHCGPAGECLAGYVCDMRLSLCVPEGTPFGGSGGTSVGGFGGSGATTTTTGGSTATGGTGTGGSPTGGSGGEGGAGGIGPVAEFACGGSTCSTPSICCITDYSNNFLGCMDPSSCADSGNFEMSCDGPEDCLPGGICCALWNNGYYGINCQPTCGGPPEYIICGPGGPHQDLCNGTGTCWADISGIWVCY